MKRFFHFATLLLLVFALGLAPAESTPLAPKDYQPHIAALVANYLSLYHYQGLRLDDTLSERIFDEYLDDLDYNRLFFLQSDVDEFSKFRRKLDDDLRKDPVQLAKAFQIFNRYRERVEERMATAKTLLEKPFDFTLDETYNLERHEGPWATSTAELDDAWRKRLKEDVLRFKLREKPESEAIDLLKKRYERLLRSVRELDEGDVLEEYLSSVARSFDPHSAYLKPMSRENFDIELGHTLEGIGASLRTEGEYTVVVELIKGGPAEQSGELHPKDKIIAVAQGDGELEDVVDMRLDNVVKKIRGPKGTVVRLQLIPADAKDPSASREITLTRDKVEITANDPKLDVKEVTDSAGKAIKLGVIDIPAFGVDSAAKLAGDPDYKSTTRDVQKLVEEASAQNVQGLVLDLRRNGGGALDEAIKLTGLFIDSGPVVQIQDSKQQVQVQYDPDPSQLYGGPLLVLTSVLSASASEILAGAIQDYGRGLIVGDKSTHGKGTVQNLISLETPLALKMGRPLHEDLAGSLKITTYKFYRVSGSSTQFKGVVPDIILPSPLDSLELGEDQLKYALPWDEIDAAPHKSYKMVRRALPALRAASNKRVAEDPEFCYLREDLQYQENLPDKYHVNLNYEKRLEEKQKLDTKEEAREQERAKRRGEDFHHNPKTVAPQDAGHPESSEGKGTTSSGNNDNQTPTGAPAESAGHTSETTPAVSPEATPEEVKDSLDDPGDFILQEALKILADYTTSR